MYKLFTGVLHCSRAVIQCRNFILFNNVYVYIVRSANETFDDKEGNDNMNSKNRTLKLFYA